MKQYNSYPYTTDMNSMNDGTNTLVNMGGSFDEYDSIDGEFSINHQTDDEESYGGMSELGSQLGGVSLLAGANNLGQAGSGAGAQVNSAATDATGAVGVSGAQVASANGAGLGKKGSGGLTDRAKQIHYGIEGLDAIHPNPALDASSEIERIKSEDEQVYEDDVDASYDDCGSMLNSELGISAGDVSAILGIHSVSGNSNLGNYPPNQFRNNETESNVNTSMDDTTVDLLQDDDTAIDLHCYENYVANHFLANGEQLPGVAGAGTMGGVYSLPAGLTGATAGSGRRLGPLGDELSFAQSEATHPDQARDLQLDIPPHPDDWHAGGYVAKGEDGEDIEDEEEHHGMLPEWLSTSNLRMRSLLVVSAALIVGSLVMAVVALGANSNWWTTSSVEDSGEESNRASFVFDVSENGGDLVGKEATSVPSFAPSLASLPTLKPVSLAPVSGESGENDLLTTTTTEATEMTEATTTSTTTEAASEATSTVSTITDDEILSETMTTTATVATEVTQAPIKSPTVSPSVEPSTNKTTTSLIVSPSVSPSYIPTGSPVLSPSGSPVTNGPTTAPSSSPITGTPTAAPSTSPIKAPISQTPTDPTSSLGSEATIYGDATFYLMAEGGTNMGFWKEKLGSLQVQKNGAKFLVHLGSAIRNVDDCLESAYVKTELSLKSTPVPAYAVPGNLDWPTCTNSTRGFYLWDKHFSSINMWWDKPAEYVVQRQGPSRPENFAFLWKRIMFVGLHVVNTGNDEETASRIQDNLNWVTVNVEQNLQDIDAIFMMGHGRFTASDNMPFYNAILSKKQNEWKDMYIIYARRASETGVTTNLGGLEKFDELKVGAEWPILDVQISTSEGKIPGAGSAPARLKYRQVLDAEKKKMPPRM